MEETISHIVNTNYTVNSKTCAATYMISANSV